MPRFQTGVRVVGFFDGGLNHPVVFTVQRISCLISAIEQHKKGYIGEPNQRKKTPIGSLGLITRSFIYTLCCDEMISKNFDMIPKISTEVSLHSLLGLFNLFRKDVARNSNWCGNLDMQDTFLLFLSKYLCFPDFKSGIY